MIAYDVNIFKINGTYYKLTDNSYEINELSGRLDNSYSYLVNLISNIEPVTYEVSYVTYTGTEVDLSTYVTYTYLDSIISDIVPVSYNVSYTTYDVTYNTEGGSTPVDLSNFVTYGYLESSLSEIQPVTYNITYTGEDGNIDLTDFVTYGYLESSLSDIQPISYNVTYTGEGGYDDTELRQLIANTNTRIDKLVQGPSVIQEISTITSNSQDLTFAEIFTVNDLFEYTYSVTRKPTSTYNAVIWSNYGDGWPSMISNGTGVSFNENIDIVDLDYKIQVSCNSTDYSQNFTITQSCAERIYLLDGNSMELQNYNARTVNLSSHVLTNYESYSSNVNWLTMQTVSSFNVTANNESTESRTAQISFTNSSNETTTFTVVQPGNPNYDPNGGGGGNNPSEVEYEMTLSNYSDGVIDENNITITCQKAEGSSAPVYNAGSSQLRMYAKNTLQVASENMITKIEFGWASHTSNATISSDVPTLGELVDNVQIWEGESQEVNFTVSDTGQYRITSIKVTVLE